MRWRPLVAVLLVVVSIGTLASPASAVQAPLPNPLADVCKTPPDPSTPDGGMAGFLVTPPETLETGDPWDPNSGTSLRDVYGYGGLQASTYDLGCAGQATSYVANMVENLVASVPVFLAALAEQVMATMMRPTFLGVFDPVIENAARRLGDSASGPVWPYLTVTMIAVALFIVVKAVRRSVSSALSAGGWALFVLGTVAVFLVSPLLPVRVFDEQTTAITQAIGAGFGGQDLADQVHREILFETWLARELGDPNAPVAQRYGRELFEAGTYSWAEWRQMREDPGAAEGLKRGKQERWVSIAEAIEEEDPVAYEHLQGKHVIPERMWRSVYATVGVFGATIFQITAGLAFIVALLTVRLLVLLWPVAAILGAFPTKRLVLLRLWERLLGAVVAMVACQAMAGLVSLFVGAVLQATMLAGWLTMFLLIGILVAAWVMLRPYRSFAGGHVGRAANQVTGAAVKAFATAAAVEQGVEQGVESGMAQQRLPRLPRTSAPADPTGPPVRLDKPPRGATAPPTHDRSEPRTGWVRERGERPAVAAYRPALPAAPEREAIGRGHGTGWKATWTPPAEESQPAGPDLRKRGGRAPRPPVYDRHGGEAIDMRRTTDKDGQEMYVPVRRRKAS